MIKKYKNTLIITSVITLLPVVAGLILWDKLPEQIATHFGVDNQPNGFTGKAFTVFGIPLLMVFLQFITVFATSIDPKNKNISAKAMNMLMWIIPVVSLAVMSFTYAYALGKSIRISFLCIMLVGAMFIFMGNYMPKVKQNYTVGIKLPWALEDDENWNKTSRFAGKLFVAGGVICCATAFLENFVILFAVILVMAVVPVIYSYRFYKSKQGK